MIEPTGVPGREQISCINSECPTCREWRRRPGCTSWCEAQCSAGGRWRLLIVAALGCCVRIVWVGIERNNPGCCVTNMAETASADWRRQVRRLIGGMAVDELSEVKLLEDVWRTASNHLRPQ